MKSLRIQPVFGLALLAAASFLPAGWGQTSTSGYTPSEGDFEFPIQDLRELKGEIIWLQGGLKRGDVTPYRNPLVPLASYEQGLLDAEGNLWTFLDNPKGRELRYNKLLRGKSVAVKGWLYDRTQIVEVYSWSDAQSHPVRSDTGYPEPIKVPFNPYVAETIEPIPPVTPEFPADDLLGEDMWKIREGLELLDGSEGLPNLSPEASEEGDRLRQFIEESMNPEAPASPSSPAPTQPGPEGIPPVEATPDRVDLRLQDEVRSAAPALPPGTSPPPADVETVNEGIERGLTDPEEMFDASRRALLE